MAADKSASVKIHGLAELNRAFKSVNGGIDSGIRSEFLSIAERVVGAAQGRMTDLANPSGRAAASVKPRASKQGAGVAFGGSAAPYFPWLDFGGSTGRGHVPGQPGSGAIKRPWMGNPGGEGRYVYPAIREQRATIERSVEDLVEKVARANQFEVRGLMARQIVVEIVGDAGKFTKATDEAAGTTGKWSDIGTGIKQGIGIGVSFLAGAAVGAITDFVSDSAAAYQEDRKSQDMLALAYNRSGVARNQTIDAIEDQISANQKLGVSDSAQRDGIATFLNLTGDSTQAMKLNAAAIELAAANGISYEEAVSAMSGAVTGRTTALKKLGIEVEKGTSLDQVAMTVMDKYGGSQEKLAQTTEGKLLVAAEKQGEAQERLGMVITKVSDVAIPLMADAFELVVDVLGEVWAAIEPVVQMLIKELEPVFKQVMAFVTGTVIPILTQVAKVVLPLVANYIGLLAKIWTTAFGVIVNVVTTAAKVIAPIISAVITVLSSIGTAIMNVATTVGKGIGNIIGFFTGIGTKIGNATRGMWDGIWNAFKSVINTLIRGWNSLKFTVPSVDLGPLGKIGGFTIGTPNIPYLHQGGIVPGVPGSDVLAMLQAGEQVTARGDVGAGGVTIVMNGNVYGTDGVDDFADILVRRMRTLGAW